MATLITGWTVTSSTGRPRKNTVRSSRRLALYCSALRTWPPVSSRTVLPISEERGGWRAPSHLAGAGVRVGTLWAGCLDPALTRRPAAVDVQSLAGQVRSGLRRQEDSRS